MATTENIKGGMIIIGLTLLISVLLYMNMNIAEISDSFDHLQNQTNSGSITKYKKHINFYILDHPTLYFIDPRNCSSQRHRLLYKYLYLHKWRTMNISNAEIFIAKYGYIYDNPN